MPASHPGRRAQNRDTSPELTESRELPELSAGVERGDKQLGERRFLFTLLSLLTSVR